MFWVSLSASLSLKINSSSSHTPFGLKLSFDCFRPSSPPLTFLVRAFLTTVLLLASSSSSSSSPSSSSCIFMRCCHSFTGSGRYPRLTSSSIMTLRFLFSTTKVRSHFSIIKRAWSPETAKDLAESPSVKINVHIMEFLVPASLASSNLATPLEEAAMSKALRDIKATMSSSKRSILNFARSGLKVTLVLNTGLAKKKGQLYKNYNRTPIKSGKMQEHCHKVKSIKTRC
uniref:Uncharacterized protein n=1 Tax=Glossina palpalis gambiensis TaxID=67801 RepID=A0A1B0C1H1_9MUSC